MSHNRFGQPNQQNLSPFALPFAPRNQMVRIHGPYFAGPRTGPPSPRKPIAGSQLSDWTVVPKKRIPPNSRNQQASTSGTQPVDPPGELNYFQKQCTFSHQVGATDSLMKCASNHRVLCLMRGVPGSGKSHCAKEIAGKRGRIFSADDYFLKASTYHFNPNELDEAHRSCFQRTVQAVEHSISPVVIDNTNINLWEMGRYVKMALKHGYEVYFVEPDTKWRYDVKACNKRNLHSVKKDTIERMLSNFDPDLSLKSFAPRDSTRPKSPLDTDLPLKTGDPAAASRQSTTHISPETPLKNCSNISESESNPRIESPDCITLTDVSSEQDRKPQQEGWGNTSWDIPPVISPSSSNASYRSESPQTQLSGKSSRNSKSILGDHQSFLGKNWSLPDNLTSGSVEASEGPAASLQDGDANFIEKCNVSIQVDEVEILKVNISIAKNGEEVDSTATSDPGFNREEVTKIPRPWKPNPVRSTEIGVQANLKNQTDPHALAGLFPDVPLESVEHILQTCDGDLEYAANILLDSNFHCDIGDSKTNNICIDETTFDESIEEEELESVSDDDTTGFVVFDLGPAMAEQLQTLFGYVQEEALPAEFMDPSSLRIRLPLNIVTQLYKHWVDSISVAFDFDESQSIDDDFDMAFPPLYQQDHELARTLQLLSDEEFARTLEQEAEDWNHAQTLAGQSGIHHSSSSSNSLASKIKEQQLQEMYPRIPPETISEVFRVNNYNMQSAMENLQFSFGEGLKLDRTIRDTNKIAQNRASVPPPPGFNPPGGEGLAEMTYQEARNEAIMHGQRRQDAMDRAREEYRKGPLNQGSAQYFLNEARKHDEKMKEANEQAAEFILKYRRRQNPPGVLDLHGLHSQESIRALANFLREYERNPARKQGTGPQVKVITGQGRHSSHRGPKIRPAVLAYLRQRDYKFEEEVPGSFRVWCK